MSVASESSASTPHKGSISEADEPADLSAHTAALNGDLEALKELLKKDSNGSILTLADPRGRTPLHYAAMATHYSIRCGNIKVVEELIKNVKDKNDFYDMIVLPMAYAAALSQTHLISTLLPITPPPTDSRPQVKTLLHYAATGGSPHFVQALLDKGYSPSTPTPRSQELPFHVACAHKHEDVAALLLSKMTPADLLHKDHAGWSALHYAAASNMPSLVSSVIARLKPSTKAPALTLEDSKGRTPLHIAAGYNATEALRLLISELPKGAAIPLDSEGLTPLHTAARGGASACIDALLGTDTCKEVDVATAGNVGLTPLHLAALGGKQEACMVLLAHGADPNKAATAKNDGNCAGAMPLHFAVAARNVRTVSILIDAGADVKGVDGMGRTPLHIAAAAAAATTKSGGGNSPNGGGGGGGALLAILRMLEKNCADVNARDSDGNTPLCVAVAHGCVRVISELIKMGADPEIVNADGQTPVHIAGRVGATIAVRNIMNHLWSDHSQKLLACEP